MINYLIGDATDPPKPSPEELNFILHICNNRGAWGAGFVLALSKRWPQPEAVYKATNQLVLGHNQHIWVEEGTYVMNMVAQDGFACSDNNFRPLSYVALNECLHRAAHAIKSINLEIHVHMPRIGCGLGGGDWTTVSEIIEEHLDPVCASINVYDLPSPTVKDEPSVTK